ncbi:MAG TPA: thioredoxin domain-containing protein [Chitinophagaceae bacterium]|nr:thioredoxin domain-containing protein [Chitinophagaceae bacterium]
MAKHSNKLASESSPYLLQHAHNPVNWYPWGAEALQKARAENKPILVSIGYAACHWCHVMERESFEDEATAAIMNEHFINIKIDREERPDLDHIYMDAVQAMTGSGGWPLNVFLTPDARPFYGGTYFPPQRAFNRPSWQEVLYSVVQAFRERRHEIDAQAENLTEHLLQANSFGLKKVAEEEIFVADKAKEAFQNLMKSADRQWGGFGKAPKFPQTFSIQYLLRYYHHTKNEEALQQALVSLDKMIDGGIYDQVGGGFARYATDSEWLVPHFEKMLYDNALLLSVISEAYQLTKEDRYRQIIRQTMQFIQREMLHPDKGFYSALDADSEGVEGKFYVWSLSEAEELLGEEAAIFCRYFDITDEGNWEHNNILWVKKPLQVFAAENNMDPEALQAMIENGKNKLLTAREQRVRPLLDDKVLLGWNALMNTACSKAYAATGEQEYLEMALANMHFLLNNFSDVGHTLFHTWKNNVARYPAFLDDYAFLIEALLTLQEVTGDKDWLKKATAFTEHVIEHFSEEETGFFYYTTRGQEDIIVRKKEVYDGAVPSGNAVMAKNLWQLSLLLNRTDWKQRSAGLVASLGMAIVRYPTSFGNWCCHLLEMVTATNEIAIVGTGAKDMLKKIIQLYIPQRIIMTSTEADESYPLLAGKPADSETAIYLCRSYTCQRPVFSENELMLLINKTQNR